MLNCAYGTVDIYYDELFIMLLNLNLVQQVDEKMPFLQTIQWT